MNLSNLIYTTLENENKIRRPQIAHYPSYASFKFSDGTLIGPDLLTQYLKWKAVPATNSSDGPGLLKMKMGDGAHKELARVLSKAQDIRIITEVPAKYKHPDLEKEISLRVDHLIEQKGQPLTILEIKSSMQQQMYGKGWGIKFKGPKLDHLLQVICYLEIIPKTVPGFATVSSAKLLYVDRGTGGFLEFDIFKTTAGHFTIFDSNKKQFETLEDQNVHEVSFQGIIDRWKQVEQAVKENKEPIPEYLAWINETTGEVMEKKTIKGKEYKTPWRTLYNDYMDYIWKNPANYKYSYNVIFNNQKIND